MNLLDAAYNVVHDYAGGSGSLAPRLGKSPTTLSHEVNGTGYAKLGLLDAEKITHLTGDLRILHAFAGNVGQMVVPLPKAELLGEDSTLLLAKLAKEFGDLVIEVSSDLLDGRISDNELARIDREAGDLIAAVHCLRSALATRNATGKPQ